jgi:hypothetical protein
MTDWNGFVGRAKKLDDIDLPKRGAEIGVGEDELHAFIDTETTGTGYDRKGRPVILFEPHVFYRNLSGAERDAAVEAGLAYKRWGTKPYPKDSYPRLLRAIKINETAALLSCSWGLFQILGENYKECGYPDVQTMVRAFMDDEENCLEAAIQFLVATGIDDDLRAHRWAVVARVYNGPGYAKNQYDTKLAANYAKWAKIPDTPWSRDAAEQPEAPYPAPYRPTPASTAITDKTVILSTQQRLSDLGYKEVGTVDGIMATKTKGAILAFRLDNDLPLVPEINNEFLAALMVAKPREIADARALATDKEVRAEVPEVKSNWISKIVALGSSITAGGAALLSGVGDNLSGAISQLKPVQEGLTDVPSYVWLLLAAGIAASIYLVARNGEKKGTEAFQSGARQ